MFKRFLLFSLILPSFAFSYTVVRSDGKSFSGSLIQQTPQETIIKDQEGVTIKFHADQIDWNQTTIQIQKEEDARTVRRVYQEQAYQRAEQDHRGQQWSGEPFSFDFKDIDIKDLFRFIADISGLNVVLDPTVKGTVTLKLTDVPWDQALDVITRNQGLGYVLEGNVIRIAPLSRLEQEETARARLEEERMLNAPLVTKIIPLSYAKASEMEAIVKRLLTRKGSTIVDRRTNTLIITDVEINYRLWDSTYGL